jgi:hypothetical protein
MAHCCWYQRQQLMMMMMMMMMMMTSYRMICLLLALLLGVVEPAQAPAPPPGLTTTLWVLLPYHQYHDHQPLEHPDHYSRGSAPHACLPLCRCRCCSRRLLLLLLLPLLQDLSCPIRHPVCLLLMLVSMAQMQMQMQIPGQVLLVVAQILAATGVLPQPLVMAAVAAGVELQAGSI